MTDAAEVDLLVLQLDDRRNLRKAFDAIDHGIGLRRTETPGKGQLLGRRDVLIPEEDDKMIEQSVANGGNRGIRQLICQVDATNFRTDRRGDRRDRHA